MRAPPPPPLPPPPAPPAPPLAAAATRQPLTLLLVSLVLPALAAAASRLCGVCASIDDFLSDHAQRAADSVWLTVLWYAPSEIFSAPEMPTPIRAEPSEETASSPVTRSRNATFDSSPPSVGGVIDTPSAQAVHQLVHDRRRATIGAAPSYRSPPRTPPMGSPPARGRAHTDDAAWACYRAGACDDDAASHCWTPPSLCGSPQGSPRAATEGQTLTKVHFAGRELPPDLTSTSAGRLATDAPSTTSTVRSTVKR